MLARLTLVAVSALVAAWFAVEYIGARGLKQGSAVAQKLTHVDPAQVRRASDDLDQAGRLNPDREPQIQRALLLVHTEGRAAGARALARVARAEPDNLEAWAILSGLYRGRDPGAYAIAQAHVRALAPPVG